MPTSAEARFFRALNRVVEPSVRKGVGSPSLAPGSIIVLETVGRQTGRVSKTPLAAIRLGRHILIATFRGRRSQWVRNLAAEPDVRFWIGGRSRRATATVIPAGRLPRDTEGFPPAAARLLPFLAPYVATGWAFAILTPRPARAERAATAAVKPRAPRRSRGARGTGRR